MLSCGWWVGVLDAVPEDDIGCQIFIFKFDKLETRNSNGVGIFGTPRVLHVTCLRFASRLGLSKATLSEI